MTLRRHSRYSRNSKLAMEWLETRSTMAADTAIEGIIATQRAVLQSLLDEISQEPLQVYGASAIAPFQSPDRAVAGFDSLRTIAVEAVPLADGSHLLLTGTRIEDLGSGSSNHRVEIEAHHTHANGQPGASFPVMSIPLAANQPLTLRAVPQGNNGFAIFYSDGQGIHGSRYAADGTREGLAMDWTVGAQLESLNFDVAMTDHGFLVAATVYESQPLLKVRLLGEADSSPFQELLIPIPTGTDVQSLHIEPREANRFVVSWIERAVGPPSANLPARWQLREFAGNSLVSSMEYDLSGFSGIPLVAFRQDGTVMFVGIPQSPINQKDLQVTWLTRDGSQRSSILPVAAFAAPMEEFSLAVQQDGSFALTGFRSSEAGVDLLTSFYSPMGDRLGSDFLVQSFSAFDRQHAGILTLQGGGYAVMWTRPALQEGLQAIHAKTLRLGEAPVTIQLGTSTVPPESAIRIDGVSEEFGFNIGHRTSPTTWQIPATEFAYLGSLRLQGMADLTPQVWTVSLLGPSGATSTARVVLGTAASESLPGLPRGRIDGQAGIDTLVVQSLAEAARVKRISDNTFFLLDINELTGYLLEQVERVQFIDEVLSMDELLFLTEKNWNCGGTLPGPMNSHTGDCSRALNLGPASHPTNTSPNSIAVRLRPSRLETLAAAVPARVGAVPIRPDGSELTLRTNPNAREHLQRFQVEADGPAERTHGGNLESSFESSLEVVLGLPIFTTQTISLSPDSGSLQRDEPQTLTTMNSRSVNLLHASFRQVVDVNVPALSVPLTNLQTRTEENFLTLAAMPVGEKSNLTTFTANAISIATPFDSEKLFCAFDEIESAVTIKDRREVELAVGTAVVIAAGYSVAQIAWLVRGSVFLTNAMSSLPIWKGFDPLPILDPQWRGLKEPAESKESLLDIVGAH